MSEEFLPCPFCGGSPYVIIDNYKGVNLHKFCCSLCDATTNSWNTHRDVAASCWNTRHNPAPQNAACSICKDCGLVWDHGADAGPGLPCDCAAGDRFRNTSRNAEDIKFALRWLNTEPNAPKHFTKAGNDKAKSIIRAALEGVTEGWQLVPIAPTNEMIDAADMTGDPWDVWKAMLAAAPKKGGVE